MPENPIFDEIERDLLHGASDVAGWFHHGRHPQAPGAQPDQLAAPAAETTTEETMSLFDTLTPDVKSDLTEGAAYVEGWIGRIKAAAPTVIADAETVGGSTVGKLAEMLAGTVLPPEVEAEFLSLAKLFVGRFGAPAAPAAPVEQPAQPAAPLQ
jgi:hypothetical protein